ncbi:MAG: thiamine pyrophosphate-binding protein, partial [Gammaproteobacteria bacterium]
MNDSAIKTGSLQQFNSHPATGHRCSGAQLLIQMLERQGITHVAGIPGGANLPIYDAITNSGIK